MAQTLTPVNEGLRAYELESILGTISKMLETKGHGLAYSLNYNLHQGKKVLTDYYERLEEAKKGFFEKDENGKIKQYILTDDGLEPWDQKKAEPGANPVGKIPQEQTAEANEMLKNFNEELLNVNFKQLDENKLNEALENSIFDGIDLTPLFDTLIK